ncbi:alpha/beta-hydrolase superfamily protein [Forsythia ovata]|uniref:Alpha/beta-hydrolase superfamily protein n=1 Tax=Forsythia ovata TaxID=205694 RepID=A0ABD1P0U1_9LAMI
MSSTTAKETKLTAPYGSWKSPITADLVSGSDKRLDGLAVDSLGRIFWIESRPTESGRTVLVRQAEKEGDTPIDITPKDFEGDTVIFSNYEDQRLYKKSISSEGSDFVPLTPDYDGPLVCYADGVFDSRFNRYLTTIVKVVPILLQQLFQLISASRNVEEPKILVEGNDFYAFPRIDHNGERVAWIEWGHPNMPWDRSELWVGYISENGDIQNRTCIAGGDPSIVESPTEPKWSPEGELFFITDRRSGFWNIYKWVESTNEVLPVYPLNAEFSRPLWYFGMNSYEFVQNHGQKNLIACSYRKKGRSYLGILDVTLRTMSLLDIPFTDLDNITSGVDCLYVEGGSAVHPLSIARVILDDQKSKAVDFSIIWASSSIDSNYRAYLSSPEVIEFPTQIPGGPTGEARGILNLSFQYWTSRGWAFVYVMAENTEIGYWDAGELIDVNDCCSCAKYLVDCGKVDGERLCITGGSAGGYTALAALAFRETFKAGTSLYGIADLKSYRGDIPKFESHYIDNLVGSENAYFERSPINFVNKFSCPIILFQGLDDTVVLPSQARKIYHALKDKGLPVALVEYEGEQHGFRKAENIKFTLEQQMMFFARLVGHVQVADDITPIKIDNLD